MLFVLAPRFSLEPGGEAAVTAVVERGDLWVAHLPPLPVLAFGCVLRGSWRSHQALNHTIRPSKELVFDVTTVVPRELCYL